MMGAIAAKMVIGPVLLLLLLSGCRETRPDWPPYVLENMWVSPKGYDVIYYELDGTYQIAYKVDVSQPATALIDEMVNQMNRRKWTRLDHYSLDPGRKANHARKDFLWDLTSDREGHDVLQWIDEWVDNKEDMVTYGLRYTFPKGEFKKACVLEVVAIYERKEKP